MLFLYRATSSVITTHFTLFAVLLVESLLQCQCFLDGQIVLNISENQ